MKYNNCEIFKSYNQRNVNKNINFALLKIVKKLKNSKQENERFLSIMEEFYSIQGEGFHTGKASYFVRTGGCDVGCSWCDEKDAWNANIHPLVSVDKIVERIEECPAKAVIVTGGEPLKYNLDYFCSELKKRNIKTYLETCGCYEISGEWDWICLSPKEIAITNEKVFEFADELKIIIFEEKDFLWAERCAAKVNKNCMLYLQPEWSRKEKNMQLIIDYALKNTKWRISLQNHKYMGIK